MTVTNQHVMYLAQKTAELLTGAQEELKTVKWKDGEANLDTGYSSLACSMAQNAWAVMQQHDPELLGEIEMVATPPDINCAFSITNATTGQRTHIASHKIELKSSETYTVPGSCIGKLDINQCIIFCKRPARNGDCAYEFAWGQYHQAFEFTDHDRLQDRTPRPNVQFKKLGSPTQSQSYQPKPALDWVSHYSQAAFNRLQQLPESKKTWQEILFRQFIDLVTPPNPLIVSIDGNIGSGKSTTWHMLKEAYKLRDDVHFVEEPVDSWHTIVDENGVPILTNFYKDKRAYAFRFQMMAYISRLALLRQTVRENAGRCRVIITERSVDTDRNIFAKMLYDSGDIAHDEYTIYNMWFDEFIKDLPVAGLVYIRADPETCIQRITKRGREGETIPIEYVQKCHDYHEAWINDVMTCKKLVIDANPEIVSDAATDEANDRIATIVRFIDAL
jgi:deoxyadenosine/deoxycytidine kinase